MNKPDTTELYNRLPVSKPEDIQDVIDYWVVLVQIVDPNWTIRFRFFEPDGYVVDIWNTEKEYVVRELFKKREFTSIPITITFDDLGYIEFGLYGIVCSDLHITSDKGVHSGQE